MIQLFFRPIGFSAASDQAWVEGILAVIRQAKLSCTDAAIPFLTS